MGQAATDADMNYDALIRGVSDVCDPFDAHILASILAIAAAEADGDGQRLLDGVGLSGHDLAGLQREFFPGAAPLYRGPGHWTVSRDADEGCLVDLLRRCATAGAPFQMRLATMLARRAQRPNHLWQDLGLRDRGELSRLMQRHFLVLATRNMRDMKWKKFLYRTICRDASYSLCSAPSCSECDDFETCFGEESGESFLARLRLAADIAA